MNQVPADRTAGNILDRFSLRGKVAVIAGGRELYGRQIVQAVAEAGATTYMIDMLRINDIRPMMMSLPPINSERYLDFLVSQGLNRQNLMAFLGDCEQIYRFHESYSLAVTTLALKNNCVYIPIREAFLASVNSPGLICWDGIHPNEKGHGLMQKVFTDMAMAS